MIKIMKRKTDNLFLKSLENDIWVSDKKEAFEMTHREYEAAKTALLGTYAEEDLIEIFNFQKQKPISDEEKQELADLAKNRK